MTHESLFRRLAACLVRSWPLVMLATLLLPSAAAGRSGRCAAGSGFTITRASTAFPCAEDRAVLHELIVRPGTALFRPGVHHAALSGNWRCSFRVVERFSRAAGHPYSRVRGMCIFEADRASSFTFLGTTA